VRVAEEGGRVRLADVPEHLLVYAELCGYTPAVTEHYNYELPSWERRQAALRLVEFVTAEPIHELGPFDSLHGTRHRLWPENSSLLDSLEVCEVCLLELRGA
jgi:hypothetical protein